MCEPRHVRSSLCPSNSTNKTAHPKQERLAEYVKASPLHDITITNILMVYGTNGGGRWGGVYCAMVVQ